MEDIDKINLKGEDFEFLITGDIEISNEDFEAIMTPNSFDWSIVQKDNWTFFKVGDDEFHYSWEPPGIQMAFNKEITYKKAKNIADEVLENIKAAGQSAELVFIDSGKIYKY